MVWSYSIHQVKWIRNISNALKFPVPSPSKTIIPPCLVNFWEICIENFFVLSTLFHLVHHPLIFIYPVHWKCTLEKSLSFGGLKKTWDEQRQEAREPGLGLAQDRLACYDFPGEKGSPWRGWALLLWLLASLGSASDHLAVCCLDPGLDLREDSLQAESPIKSISLPDSKPQVAPVTACGTLSSHISWAAGHR